MARTFSRKRLQEARLAAGLKPEQLALRIDRSVFTVHQYERGHCAPPAKVLGIIADELGCSVEDFYTREAVTSGVA